MKSIKNIKVDLNELKKFKEENARERLKFIDWWVEYMKKQEDKEWSKHQNSVIDSQIKNN
ncbi:hypothetical protein HY212_07570 [Candidatus Pacearchaeota archaeon]|nr:hypothetical protein [Candidatus Pacearchaeota archaeon]